MPAQRHRRAQVRAEMREPTPKARSLCDGLQCAGRILQAWPGRPLQHAASCMISSRIQAPCYASLLLRELPYRDFPLPRRLGQKPRGDPLEEKRSYRGTRQISFSPGQASAAQPDGMPRGSSAQAAGLLVVHALVLRRACAYSPSPVPRSTTSGFCPKPKSHS